MQYARFDATGRTDKIAAAVNDPVVGHDGVLAAGTGSNPRGRYALHFHHTLGDGAATAALVKGCVVSAPGSWGMVNHDSNVVFEDNLVVDAKGAAFVTEIGTEIGRFTRSMVVGVAADKATKLDLASTNLDWGRGGHAFFMTGFATPIDGAVLTGVRSAGNAIEVFAWRAAVLDANGKPANSKVAVATLDPALAAQIAKGRSEVVNDEVPFTVKNVVVYSSNALLDQHAHLGGFLNTVDNAVVYGASGGVGDQYSTGLTVTNSKFYGRMFNAAFGNDWKTQLRIENTAIKGFNYGIVVPQNGTTYFKSLDLANVNNLVLFRVDQYQYLEVAPRSQVIAENIAFGRGDRYGYWAPGASTAWSDVIVPSDRGVPAGVETGFDSSVSLFFSRAGDAFVRRHQTLFKPWNIQINGKQIYSDDQRADYRVHDTGLAELDGKSNAELQAFCSMGMMDQLMPAAVAAPPVGADGWFVDADGLRIWGRSQRAGQPEHRALPARHDRPLQQSRPDDHRHRPERRQGGGAETAEQRDRRRPAELLLPADAKRRRSRAALPLDLGRAVSGPNAGGRAGSRPGGRVPLCMAGRSLGSSGELRPLTSRRRAGDALRQTCEAMADRRFRPGLQTTARQRPLPTWSSCTRSPAMDPLYGWGMITEAWLSGR